MLHLIPDFLANFPQAFRANFNIYDIPEILATPCCSQIAVTKERILSIPREQYQHHIDWLLKTSLPDSISGRTWGNPYSHTNLLFFFTRLRASGAGMIPLCLCLTSQDSSFASFLDFEVLICGGRAYVAAFIPPKGD
jgi:hypothetical protein